MQDANFADQVPIEFIFCDYPLLVPSKHVLTGFFDPRSPIYQPYRETGLVKIARAIERLHRTGTVIDIGANVGDTCAILHRHCSLKILSIDASDFFFSYLARNVERLFADRAIARQAFVLASREETAKGLYHWGGTAKAVDAPATEHCEAIAIGDLIASVEPVALLKVDIDGFDIELISGVFDDPDATPRFPIYFEYEFADGNIDEIRARCARSLDFFRKAAANGYVHAFVWDDPGRFYGLIDVRNTATLVNAINYMGHFQHRSVYGYDICLVHESDTAFLKGLSGLLSAEMVLPLVIDR